MDEQYLYHREALNNWDYLEDDWAKTDDAQFADVSDFDLLETAFSILPDNFLYSVGDNDSQQPEKEGDSSQGLEKNLTNFDNLESKLLKPLEEPLETNSGSNKSLR